MAGNLNEIGRSGLLISGGIVQDDLLQSLHGPQGRRIFREMSDNDPVIGAFIMAFVETLARLDWHFEVPDDASADDQKIADYVQECLEDMEEDWQTTLTSILSMVPYGWSFHEVVYKIRGGMDTTNLSRQSRFKDGKIGWRKWAPRSQESLLRWELDDTGQLVAMTQLVYGYGGTFVGGTFTIPMEKALLFRPQAPRGNPEGRSLLRNAYRPWFFKKRIEEIEAIGVERDLAGLPVAWLSPDYFSPSASPDEVNLFNQVQTIVRNIKRNEMEGVLMPLIYDEKGNKTIDLELMTSGGSRQFDTDKIIGRYNQQIAMTVLADFLMLGHENVGTQSLGTSKISLFMLAVEALAKAVAETVNRYAVPRLLKLNGFDTENPPRLVYGDIEKADIVALGTFLQQAVSVGVITPDATLEEFIRDIANLPPIDEEAREEPEPAQVPLTPEEMAAYTAVGAKPPMTKPAVPVAPAPSQGEANPAVKPGTNVEANAKEAPEKPTAKPGAKPGSK